MPLTLRIVIYDDKGLVNIIVKRIEFNKLAVNRIIRLDIADNNREDTRTFVTTFQPSTIEPLVSAIRVLEDSYEWNATIVLAMLDLDSISFGELKYRYYSN